MSYEQDRPNRSDLPPVRAAFDARLEGAEGDITDAVGSITDPVDALFFVYGYQDLVVETTSVHPNEAYRLVLARITQHLTDNCGGDQALLGERRELWDPVFDAVKRKEDMNSPATWERMRDAVRLFDQADERFLLMNDPSGAID